MKRLLPHYQNIGVSPIHYTSQEYYICDAISHDSYVLVSTLVKRSIDVTMPIPYILPYKVINTILINEQGRHAHSSTVLRADY